MITKPTLITVTDGNRTDILDQYFLHYKNHIKAAVVVIYQHENFNHLIKDKIEIIGKKYGISINILYRSGRLGNGYRITSIYNEVKRIYPNDWWIIADDDEFQVYAEPILDLIQNCEENKSEYVAGGFIDRIGPNGNLVKITKNDLWETFPLAASFRHALSRGCESKVCLCKGKVKLSVGQHFIQENNNTIYGKSFRLHPKRYQNDQSFIQVHHFKWDDTALKRLIYYKQDYDWSKEFQLMHDSIARNNFKIDINNPDLFVADLKLKKDYNAYIHWEKVKNRILYRN